MKSYASRKTRQTNGVSDPVKAYLKDLLAKEPLSKEKEYKLFDEYFKNGDRQAYNQIVEGNLRLVVKLARGYTNRGMALLDLVEEGNLGLMHAIDKFEPERGYRFSTYATWWIRQNIERAIMNQTRQIRLPVHVIKQLTAYLNAGRKMGKSQGESVAVNEIADFFDKEVDDVQKIMGYKLDTMSLDAQVFDDSDINIKGAIPDPKATDPADIIGDESTNGVIQEWLDRLDELDHAVIIHRYGLCGCSPKTLEGVGQSLGLTRERVRQIQMRALSRLRRFMNFSGVDKTELNMIDTNTWD